MRLNISYEHDIPINAFEWTPETRKDNMHIHTSLEIGLCLSGRGTFYFGEKQFQVSAGDIFLVNNEELHIAESDPDDPSLFLFLNFDPALLLAEDPSLLLPFSYRSPQFRNMIAAGSQEAIAIRPWIQAVADEFRDKQPGYLAMAKSALIRLCVILLRGYYSQMDEADRPSTAQSVQHARMLTTIVEQRYRDQIGLDDIADELGISVSRASRVFYETTGKKFSDYVNLLRVQETKRLLASSGKSVADIGFECGFQSLATFYRVFKDYTGLSPSVYRQTFGLTAKNENSPPAE